jgi:hypothetical protein
MEFVKIQRVSRIKNVDGTFKISRGDRLFWLAPDGKEYELPGGYTVCHNGQCFSLDPDGTVWFTDIISGKKESRGQHKNVAYFSVMENQLAIMCPDRIILADLTVIAKEEDETLITFRRDLMATYKWLYDEVTVKILIRERCTGKLLLEVQEKCWGLPQDQECTDKHLSNHLRRTIKGKWFKKTKRRLEKIKFTDSGINILGTFYDIFREKIDECLICQEEFIDGSVNKFLGCGHMNFHESCINDWLKINPTCPNCRKVVS